MHRRVLLALLSILSLTPALAVAQSGTQEGRYINLNDDAVVTERSDGGELHEVTFRQATFSTNGEFPLDEILSDCSGVFLIDGAGEPTHASGNCMGSDLDGDRIAWWWQMTEVATRECAGMCGTFGLYGGQGKYEGITGEGIWERQTEHVNGGFGTWLLDYSR